MSERPFNREAARRAQMSPQELLVECKRRLEGVELPAADDERIKFIGDVMLRILGERYDQECAIDAAVDPGLRDYKYSVTTYDPPIGFETWAVSADGYFVRVRFVGDRWVDVFGPFRPYRWV